MLSALAQAGIVADLLVGSSVGALNALAFAADPTSGGIRRLSMAWHQLRRADIFPLTPHRLLLGAAGRRDHLISNRGLQKVIARVAGIERLEDAVIPVHVVAADLRTGEPVVISRGEVMSALLASTAIPGLFHPIELGGRTLIDGGVAADTPLAQAEALGATNVYVLPTYGTDPMAARPRSAVAIGLRAVEQLLAHSDAGQIAAAACSTVHVLPVPPTSEISPFDIARSARLIDEAARLTASWLERDEPATPVAAIAI
jgi:NTE family protein